jgi:hypothetical protein
MSENSNETVPDGSSFMSVPFGVVTSHPARGRS